MNILSYSAEDILFSYWLHRKIDILSSGKGMWRGAYHPNPDCLHVEIDKQLDKLRPLRTPDLYLLNFNDDYTLYHYQRTPTQPKSTPTPLTPKTILATKEMSDELFSIVTKN